MKIGDSFPANVFAVSQLYLLIPILFLTSCGGVDLAFMNEVKVFEPKWTILSEKITFIKRHIDITDMRYDADIQQVEKGIGATDANRQDELRSLRSRYLKVVEEKDELKEGYSETLESFKATIYAFNDWENRLMQNDLETDEAKLQFVKYQNFYTELYQSVDSLQTQLIKNIERHNSLLQSMTQLMDKDTNFKIEIGS